MVKILLGLLALTEIAFYGLFYLPKKRSLQKPATHPPLLPRAEREKLFKQARTQVADIERYLTTWFQKAPLSEIKRENVKEFCCWAMLNKAAWGPEDEEELEGYAQEIEELLGRPLEGGRGSATPLRLTIDPVYMQHRPLAWYLIVLMIDVGVYSYLTLSGFTYFRLSFPRLFTSFPFRLHTLFSRRSTTSPILSYYYTPHKSDSNLPILFIHGIGIGLYPYSRLLTTLQRRNPPIGIIAIEIPQISSRITNELPTQQAICHDIRAILDRHGWSRFVLVSHSFGSVVAANMLKDPVLTNRMPSMVFADPVAFLLHLPDVAYNFTRRPPRQANEHQLHYFASMDMFVSHTLSRHFFWAENVLWKEDLEGRDVTVALSGRDIIVPTVAVKEYLTEAASQNERQLASHDDGVEDSNVCQETPWSGKGLEVLWFEHCDHAEMFETRREFMRIVDAVTVYSSK